MRPARNRDWVWLAQPRVTGLDQTPDALRPMSHLDLGQGHIRLRARPARPHALRDSDPEIVRRGLANRRVPALVAMNPARLEAPAVRLHHLRLPRVGQLVHDEVGESLQILEHQLVAPKAALMPIRSEEHTSE